MTVYTCIPEYEDMLTCIYTAMTSRLGHKNIRLELEPIGQYNLLDEYVHVDGDSSIAQKVIDAINTKISTYFYREVMYCAHYHDENVLDNIYRMLLLGFKFGHNALDMVQYEAVNNNLQYRRAFSNEVCHFREFSRFHLINNSVYIAHIEPRSRVAIALGPIFSNRMPSENWMIVDDTHSEAVIHPADQPFYMQKLSSDELSKLKETENNNDIYTDMWKAFFDSIAIAERINPECQRNHMPLWTRKHSVEFQ